MKLKHTHKYERVRWGRNGTIIFRCVLSNCSHYIHRELAKNRPSLCWVCGKEFNLSAPDLQRKHPKCQDCTKSKAKIPTEPAKPSIPVLPDFNIDDLLENL